MKVQRRFIKLILKFAGPFRLLFESKLLLLDIALELKDGLLSVLEVCLLLIHFLDKLIVLGLVDPQQVLLMSSLPLLLLELPLLVINRLVRGI